MISKKIAESGYEVVTAANGKQALGVIRTQAPDVIILDITMPQMDGLAVLEEIRKRPPSGKWQPVIMVSGHTDLENLRKAYDLEADHYIAKPCKSTDIQKAMEIMIRLIPQRQKDV
jgi:two-component system alkaline phosphatase synthesis response regulator PhoP